MKFSDNKETALNLSIAIMTGQWQKVDELLDDNFMYRADARPPLDKKENINYMKNILCSAMTDMEMKFIHVIEEGNLIAVNYSNSMTNTGSFMGFPATGKRVIASGQFVREIKNGKIIAEWQSTNVFALMLQLGIVPNKSIIIE